MMQKAVTDSAIPLEQRLALPCLIFSTFGMAIQLFSSIYHYAVNILFSDQWDTYRPLFRGDNNWQIFTVQEGQMRLGVGGLLYKGVALATEWNTRAESYAIGIVLLLTTFAAIYLKWRLFKKITVWDSFIPFVCLGVYQFETPLVVPYPSHAAVPIFLLFLYAIALTYKNYFVRLAGITILNFLMLFTGWGVFVGFITPLVLIFLFVRNHDSREKPFTGLAFLISIGMLAFYFYDYQFHSGVECQLFSNPLWDYFLFFAKLFTYTMGMPCETKSFLWKSFGAIVVISVFTVLICNMWKLFQTKDYEDKNLAVTVLIVFSLSFALVAAVGRVCTSECAGDGGRYQCLLLPAWIGFYFGITMLEKQWYKRSIEICLLSFCFVLPQSFSYKYRVNIKSFSEFKTKWKYCYLEKEDALGCDKETGFSIFSPIPSNLAQDRIDFLKQRHLNFFTDKQDSPEFNQNNK